MPRRLRIPLAGAAIAALVYGGVAYVMAAAVTQAERHAVEQSPSDHGLTFEDVEFHSRVDRIRLSGWWMPGADSSAAVVIVHGIHATRESDHALDIAAQLVDAGFSVLLFDLRGHGRSAGDEVSGGYFERRDLQGAVDFVVERRGRRVAVGVLGNSMGAAISLLTAAIDPRIQAVVADSPFADAADMIPPETTRTTGIPQWLVPIFVPGMKLESRLIFGIEIADIVPLAAAAKLEYPVLLIHGTADTRIPFSQSVRIQQHLRHPDSALWLVPEADHVKAFEIEPEAYIRRVVSYFESRLGSSR